MLSERAERLGSANTGIGLKQRLLDVKERDYALYAAGDTSVEAAEGYVRDEGTGASLSGARASLSSSGLTELSFSSSEYAVYESGSLRVAETKVSLSCEGGYGGIRAFISALAEGGFCRLERIRVEAAEGGVSRLWLDFSVFHNVK
jgi:hypothetical protein